MLAAAEVARLQQQVQLAGKRSHSISSTSIVVKENVSYREILHRYLDGIAGQQRCLSHSSIITSTAGPNRLPTLVVAARLVAALTPMLVLLLLITHCHGCLWLCAGSATG